MAETKKSLKIAIPKGSLQEPTIDLFRKAGYRIYVSSRGYRPSSDDPELDFFMIRAQEIGRYIAQGFIDCGITGLDWAQKHADKLEDFAELPYSRASARPTRWVLVVPENSPITKPEDLQGKRIATEGVEITRQYLEKKGIEADVEFSWGATEVKVPELVDAIVEVTETGSTIRANGLRIVEELLVTNTQLIANKAAWNTPWKREKIEQIALLLTGALKAMGMVGMKLNVSKENLEKVIKLLPSLNAPTISPLYQSDWFAVETVLEEREVRDLIPKLQKAGAEGIIEYSLNKII